MKLHLTEIANRTVLEEEISSLRETVGRSLRCSEILMLTGHALTFFAQWSG